MKELMVPLDGSPAGETALDVAVALAKLCGARVHVVHVATAVSNEPMGVERFPVQAWSEKYLQEVITRIGAESDAEIEATILDGDVVDALLDHARAVAADLVVMTTHGRGPSSRFWLGSVTDRYLRTAEKPVLVVRPDDGRAATADGSLRLRKIVVPLDGSEESERALDVALSVARLTDAELGLLRVVERPTRFREASEVDPAWSEGAEMERARRYLAGVARRIPPGTLASTEVRSHAEAAIAVLDFVHEWSGDLVVMCTRGLGVARRFFLGSVTDKVVRGGTVSVLVVPRRD